MEKAAWPHKGIWPHKEIMRTAMALKAIYERAEEIPEDFSALFTERDGRYELTGVAGMKTAAADTTR